MSWQALAARVDTEYEADDESWVALSNAYRTVYQQAATVVWPRLLNRVNSLTAAGGASDQLVTDDEWAALLAPAADDATGDSINDGLIAIMILLGIMLPDHKLDEAAAEVLASDASFLRASLDDWISANLDKGWNIEEWHQELFNSGASPLSPERADRWARTQAHSAVNAGYSNGLDACGVRNSAALADYQCDDVAAIRWVTQRDDRVRPAHAAVDRDTIPLGELFMVGGHPARYPGDPTLPIGLRINCRCELAWVDGTEVRRITGGRYRDLYGRARDLDVRGRSKMSKAELQTAILEELCLQGLAGGPDCPDLFEQMNKSTLLAHARRESITGRWKMTRAELIENLRATMRGSDRLRVAQGYAPRSEFNEAQRVARRKRSTASRLLAGDRGLPEMAARRVSRETLFAEFGGPARGHVPCVFCGLKLHPSVTSGLAVLVPTPIVPFSQGGVAAAINMLPGCTACFGAHSALSAVALAASGGTEKGEEFDGDPDDGVNLAWWRDRLLSIPLHPIRDTQFHLAGTANDHDQKTHAGGRRTNIADYNKWTTIDGPNGRLDVQPGIFPNSVRVTYHSTGSEREVDGQEAVVLDLMFDVDADGNISGVTVDDVYDLGDEFRHPSHKRDAIALIKDEFADVAVTGPDWDQDPGELYRTPLGQALGQIGGFKVGDEEFRIEFDEGSAGVKGKIIDVETGETAGGFEREFDGETLYNQKLEMVPWYRGRGIGTTFADVLESAMAERGADRTTLTAADVGKYAWAARGYEATDLWFDQEEYDSVLEAYNETGEWSTGNDAVGWVMASRNIIDNTMMGNTRAAALERLDRVPERWEFDGIYPGYLIGVDPEVAKTVLLNGPQWSGTRYIVDSYAWKDVATGPVDVVDEPDPNQLLLPLALEQFHLAGQHDQKSHGNRGGRRSSPTEFVPGRDLTSDPKAMARLASALDAVAAASNIPADVSGTPEGIKRLAEIDQGVDLFLSYWTKSGRSSRTYRADEISDVVREVVGKGPIDPARRHNDPGYQGEWDEADAIVKRMKDLGFDEIRGDTAEEMRAFSRDMGMRRLQTSMMRDRGRQLRQRTAEAIWEAQGWGTGYRTASDSPTGDEIYFSRGMGDYEAQEIAAGRALMGSGVYDMGIYMMQGTGPTGYGTTTVKFRADRRAIQSAPQGRFTQFTMDDDLPDDFWLPGVQHEVTVGGHILRGANAWMVQGISAYKTDGWATKNSTPTGAFDEGADPWEWPMGPGFVGYVMLNPSALEVVP